jgi:hypothetical protein
VVDVWERKTNQKTSICSDEEAGPFWNLKLKDGRNFSEATGYSYLRSAIYGVTE